MPFSDLIDLTRLTRFWSFINTKLNGKYDKTGGDINGNVKVFGTITQDIENEDYDSGIRAAAPYGGHYIGSYMGQKPNDANRLFTVTCAISADKTSFAVIRMTTLYGTAATNNSDVNAYVFKIEGYYD